MGNQNFRTLRGGQSKLQKEKIPVQYHQHLKQAPNHLFISIDSKLSQILKCGVMMMMMILRICCVQGVAAVQVLQVRRNRLQD